GLDLKYHLHLVLGLEGYGRAGLHKTWLSQSVQSEMAAYQGDGHVLGGGLQYTFDILPRVDAAVWADYSHQVFELDDAAAPLPLAEIEKLHIARTLRYTEGSKRPRRGCWGSTSRP
ncbi:MAG: hypothetical protein HC897_09805, partial [Thermoanaerobaculia bacterium]|nr:hypothetical protein [Thermoanaerobaculia bacterium]